jgi:hypothetical protein
VAQFENWWLEGLFYLAPTYYLGKNWNHDWHFRNLKMWQNQAYISTRQPHQKWNVPITTECLIHDLYVNWDGVSRGNNKWLKRLHDLQERFISCSHCKSMVVMALFHIIFTPAPNEEAVSLEHHTCWSRRRGTCTLTSLSKASSTAKVEAMELGGIIYPQGEEANIYVQYRLPEHFI